MSLKSAGWQGSIVFEFLQVATARLGIPHSNLFDALLEHALTAEAKGHLCIVRRPAKWQLERVYSAE